MGLTKRDDDDEDDEDDEDEEEEKKKEEALKFRSGSFLLLTARSPSAIMMTVTAILCINISLVISYQYGHLRKLSLSPFSLMPASRVRRSLKTIREPREDTRCWSRAIASSSPFRICIIATHYHPKSCSAVD